jgi:outer membrane lipopolysaccharide assembly protein LptE/RlpB
MKPLQFIPLLMLLLYGCTNNVQDSKVIELQIKVTKLENDIADIKNTLYNIQEALSKNKIKVKDNSTSFTPLSQPSEKTQKKTPSTTKNNSTYSSSSTTKNYSGQCMATTKKGTRCKRSARSNGYCWQHGG